MTFTKPHADFLRICRPQQDCDVEYCFPGI